MYFYVRNRFEINKTRFSNRITAALHYLFFLTAFAGTIMLYQKTNKVKKLNFLIWPVTDAIRNNYSVTPPVIMKELNQRNSKAIQFSLITPFKNLFNAVFPPGTNGGSKPAAA